MVDKGKGKEKKQVREVGEGEDEGEVDTAMAGMVEDGGEGQHASGLSKPASRGQNQSHTHSQSRGCSETN